jgi:hypothetical protein
LCSSRYLPRFLLGDISGSSRLKILFDVRVGKAAIVQVNAQLRLGNGPSRKQGADRFKDDLMLRLVESVRAEGLDEILPQIASDRLIAKRAKGLEFGCDLFFVIHCNSGGGISLPSNRF